MGIWPLFLLITKLCLALESNQDFLVTENAPIGTVIGTIGSGPGLPSPPYLILPSPGSQVDQDFIINPDTGVIRTKTSIDREVSSTYSFNALSLVNQDDSIKVKITVKDVNDNSPTFLVPEIQIDIPENTPKGTRRKLEQALDADLGQFGTQGYRIESGNTDNTFSLSDSNSQNIELIVNGHLDREKVDKYSLRILALDGGSPPRSGTLTVHVNVQDLNDNPPIFSKQRYFETISSELPPGQSVLQVEAKDADIGKNSEIVYSINRRQADKDGVFHIDSKSGIVRLAKHLDFDRKNVHEIVVVARDNGQVPQESSAFVTVRLTSNSGTSSLSSRNSYVPKKTVSKSKNINLKLRFFNQQDNRVSETARIGDIVAQFVLSDPYIDPTALRLELVQSDAFDIFKNSSGNFLRIANRLNHDIQSKYSLTVRAQSSTDPNQDFVDTFDIFVEDSNSFPPKFEKELYTASLDESSPPGTSVIKIQAHDPDNGENGRVQYSLSYESEGETGWFQIDPDSGVVSSMANLDCEVESNPKVVIVAKDFGYPSLSSSSTLSVSIKDVNDHSPIFEKSFYSSELLENQDPGHCFLKVKATDLDCGVNSEVQYHIKEATAREFTINEQTGNICLSQYLDREKQRNHRFTVIASDKGGLSTTSMVKITVKDVNDNYPTFKPSDYKTKIRSRYPSHTDIIRVFAEDKDEGPAGTVTYSIASGNDEGLFQMDPDTGSISLTRSLSSSRQQSHYLSVTARDGEGLESESVAYVEIHVDNDDLTFDMPQYTFEVMEDISPYSDIEKLPVAFTSKSAEITIYDSSVYDHISIDKRSGMLRTEARLDHEVHPLILLNVRLNDRATFIESFCQVIIKVKDVNDNSPDFGSSTAMITLPENIQVGAEVYNAKAGDDDQGFNGKIEYKLIENVGNKFQIDEETGVITLANSLDYEDKKEYLVVIEAKDFGSPRLKSTLKLTVRVHDVNDNQPVFEKSMFVIHIAENQDTNSPIATIKASDEDAGKNGRVSYYLEENPYVSILKNNGIVILKRPLDMLKQNLILKVTALDHGDPQLRDQAEIKILMSDRNENSPIFEKREYVFHVLENMPLGTFVGQVKAFDGDSGTNGEIEYHLASHSDAIFMNKATGKLLTSKSLDRETKHEHNLIIKAIDHGSPRRSSQTFVQVLVDDVNDNPPKLIEPSDKTLYVKKTSKIGSIVGKLISQDPDKTSSISYELKDSQAFSINNQGHIRILESPVNLVESVKQLKVELSDNGSPVQKRTEVLLVKYLAEGEDKVSIKQLELKLSQRAKVGSFVGKARSSHLTKEIFRFADSDSNSRFFTLNATDSSLYVAKDLSDIKSDSVTINVIAQESDVTQSPETIAVKIVFEKSAHSFQTDEPLISVNIPEDLAVGSTVLKMADYFQIPVEKLQIVEEIPQSKFQIEQQSTISLKEELDYEENQRFLLVVRAFSTNARFTSDVTVVFNVEDVNDNAPIFQSGQELRLTFETPIATPIFNILTSDSDSGLNGKVSLTIAKGGHDGNDLHQVFQILPETNQLILNQVPLRHNYNLHIEATDQGSPPLTTTQVLNVNFLVSDNENLRFGQKVYYANIEENLPKHQTVLTVGLTSGSSSERVKYSILQGRKLFAINDRTGEIQTLTSLDRESEAEHAIVVSVEGVESSKIADTAVVYIKVDDINDNSPDFGQTCRDVTIPENNPHTFIHVVVASDLDEGENRRVVYSLKEGFGQFYIERETGKILTNSPLDREEQDFYELEVTATDFGKDRRTTKCLMSVTVSDENDNDPSFDKSTYPASVREDIPVGTEILRVSASDADVGVNAEIIYSLENSTSWHFDIDEVTGAIFNTEKLDREAITHHQFDILATDKGKENIRSSRTQVKIIVTDANDHQPKFDQFPFYINMTATPKPGVPLLQLKAHDPDEGPNGQLTYDIGRSPQRERFHLSPVDGILTVASPDLLWEPGTIETLEVTVSDAGSPPKSSTGLVSIVIEGGPKTTLKFQNFIYETTIREHPQSGSDVMQVRAVRSDGRSRSVVYTFVQGNDLGAFEINSNNGLIRVRDSDLIDFEHQTQFNLTVSGQGLGSDDLTAYATCIVRLTDINDHAPRFTRQEYNIKILEGKAKNSAVTVTKAVDLDFGQTDVLKYNIMDGNIDNAFAMDSARPGMIVTNIVLDREIRDVYTLTISASDNGEPSLIGVAVVHITVIDINDNRPNFSPTKPIEITKETKLGSVVGHIRANDADIYPDITYTFSQLNEYLALNTFTGQLTLLKQAQFEEEQEIEIIASDSIHETRTKIHVKFDQSNRICTPIFDKPLNNFFVAYNETYPSTIGAVNAKSCVGNDEIVYGVSRKDQSFISILQNGTLVLKREYKDEVLNFLVTATDARSKKYSTTVITISKSNEVLRTINFSEDIKDTLVLKMPSSHPISLSPVARVNADSKLEDVYFTIEENDFLQVESNTGDIFLKHGLAKDFESIPNNLDVTVRKLGTGLEKTKNFKIVPFGLQEKFLTHFKESEITVNLAKSSLPNTQIDICPVESKYSDIPFIKIISGNERNLLILDSEKMKLKVYKHLQDLDADVIKVVLKLGSEEHFSVCQVNILLQNMEVPSSFHFISSSFTTSLPENSPLGTELSLPPSTGYGNLQFWTNSFEFKVKSETDPRIITNINLDYEFENTYNFILYANDSSGLRTSCAMTVLVESKDEYPPVMEQTHYYFSLDVLAQVGDIVGQVRAQDRDKGPDGFVSYEISPATKYFAIDPANGIISVSHSLDTGLFNQNYQNLFNSRKKRSIRDSKYQIIAKSRQPESLTAMAEVTMSVDEAMLPVAISPSEGMSSMLQGVLVSVILLLIILVSVAIFICWKRKKQEELRNKQTLVTSPSGNPNISMEMTNSSETPSRLYPPQYSEIVSDYDGSRIKAKSIGTNSRSELSDKSHRSASSGRGSVEDEEGVDVEIRMINEGNYMASDNASFVPDDDKASEGSIQNTEEYLARLGIDIRKPPNINISGSNVSNSGDILHNFEPYGSGIGGSSIYNRIPEDNLSEKNSVISAKHQNNMSMYGSNFKGPSVTGSISSIGPSEDGITSSMYNWDYLLDWGPKYQPMAHVFKEISKLKDNDSQANTKAANSGLMISATANGTSSTLGLRAGSGLPFALNNPRTSHLLPRSTRSPISHDMLTQNALSPNFHPGWSPLSAKSPSISPMTVPSSTKRILPNQRL